MTTAVLILHLFIAIGLVSVVLLQRSEGGALGIGGGGGGLMSGRGAANLLTRTTSILGTAFFITSIVLTVLANRNLAPGSIVGPGQTPATAPAQPAPGTGGGVLDRLRQQAPASPQPAAPQPAAPQPAAPQPAAPAQPSQTPPPQ